MPYEQDSQSQTWKRQQANVRAWNRQEAYRHGLRRREKVLMELENELMTARRRIVILQYMLREAINL